MERRLPHFLVAGFAADDEPNQLAALWATGCFASFNQLGSWTVDHDTFVFLFG
jgi:hypothetical protein